MTLRSRFVGIIFALTAVLAGCSSDDDTSGTGGSGSFSIAEQVRQLPSTLDDASIQISAGDLDAATEAAGLERPSGDESSEEVLDDWLIPLSGLPREGVPPVSASMPMVVQPQQFGQLADFRKELGWDVTDVSWFVEYQMPPTIFSVLGGDFAEDEIDDAIPERVDGVWKIGAEDLGQNLRERSAARPLGESLRFALRDDVLVVARETPVVEEWLADDFQPLATEHVVEVAEVLDDAGVYSALILAGESRPGHAYEVLGLGVGLEDGEASATFVYRFADDATATEYAERVEALLRTGSTAASGRPWSELLSIEDVSTEGPVLVVEVHLEDLLPRQLMQIVYVRDNIVALD